VAPSEEQRPRDALVHASLVAVQIAFATLSVVGRVVLREVPPMAFASLRLVFAALAFAAFSPASFGRALPWRDKAGIAVCAALGIYGNQALFLSGLARTTATNATVLVAAIPIFAALSAIALGRDRPRPRVLAGIGLAFSGIVYLVGVEALELGGDHTIGDLLVTANSAVYALYLVLVRDYVAKHGGLRVVAWGFFCGALFSLPLGLPALVEAAPHVSASTWGWVGYAILVPTIFTYLTNAWALRWASTSTVAIYIYIQPTIAALLAWHFLGEEPNARLLVAALLVFAGIWVVTRTPVIVPETASGGASKPAPQKA
jgi:drug/metabolite transporter (DMT)-like permease